MVKASDNVFPRLLISEGGSTATPAAGNVTVYAKADGLLYSKDDAGAESLVSGAGGGGGGGALTVARIKYSGGNFSTSSTSKVDVDATNASLSITTGANPVLIGVTGRFGLGTGGYVHFDLAIDGTDQGGTHGLHSGQVPSASFNERWLGFTYLSAALTAAAHTIKLRWFVNTGSATLYADSTVPLHMYAIEMAN